MIDSSIEQAEFLQGGVGGGVSIADRIRNPEDHFVERKSASAKGAELREALVAFANSSEPELPGLLVIGMRNDGTPQGVPSPDTLQRTIQEICKNECWPPIRATSEVHVLGGKEVVVAIVPASKDRPHFSGHAFVRKGSQTAKASAELFEELILSRNSLLRDVLRLRNQMVTVRTIDKMLGNPHPPQGRHGEVHECLITEVTRDFVTLQKAGTLYIEELAGITLSRDAVKHRPMLIVRPLVK